MSARVCPQCGKSAYGFPKCPWCGSSYSQTDSGAQLKESEMIEEKQKPKGAVWFGVALLILFVGPIALGILGVALKFLNDFLGFSPASQDGVIAVLYWAPILVYISWPMAALIIVIFVILAILKGLLHRGAQK